MHAIIFWGCLIAAIIYYRNRPRGKKPASSIICTSQAIPAATISATGTSQPAPFNAKEVKMTYDISGVIGALAIVLMPVMAFMGHTAFAVLCIAIMLIAGVGNFVAWVRLKRNRHL